MNQLYIVRGLPGSGKTTLAHTLANEVCEADHFFLDKDGTYKYEASKIADAHGWCQAQVQDAMMFNISPIVVSNTFVKRWEMDAYYRMARVHGYQVTEITMSGELHGSIHGVPAETIIRMREEWEK